MINLIQEACNSGARLPPACATAELSLRTYRRWYHDGKVCADKRSEALRPEPQNKLTEAEREAVVAVCNTPEYASLPPSQIVPSLLDQGIYLASESSFYRILNTQNQLHHRGQSHASERRHKPESYTAASPNCVWSWDITFLPTHVKGRFYYLYMFVDIYSRLIVGYEVHEEETGELSAQLIQRCMLKQQCHNQPLVLHSDNGASMKSRTMLAKLEELGVTPSRSRPSVSNDNPFSEALFRTLKYRPEWPSSGFETLEDARTWVQCFVDWYNSEHKHSKLNFVTPAQRHAGEDAEILANRRVVLENAKTRNPLRWSKGVRNCSPVAATTLNPDKLEKGATEKAA